MAEIMDRLIKARDLIAQRGLAQNGKFYDIRRKCFCTVGSLIAVDYPNNPEKFMGRFGRIAVDNAEVAAASNLIGEVLGYEAFLAPLFSWSDRTPVDEVLLTFDKAIELARVRNV